MLRRKFIAFLGGALAARPAWASAQPAGTPVIGLLNSSSPMGFEHLKDAFRRGLNDAGFVEGQNVTIEYRWAEGKTDRLPALARDLVGRRVDVLVAVAGTASAAKAATSTIPIISLTGYDPVAEGLVTSLNRPGGNLTGMTTFTGSLEAKRLELLHELLPEADTLAALINPSFRNAEMQYEDVEMGASRAGVNLVVVYASAEREFEAAFRSAMERGAKGLAVCADPYFNSRRGQLVALAAGHGVPAVYEWREFVEAGGLMSYGTSLTDAYRQIGVYAGAILKGAKPSELPVLQPTRFELVISLRTANDLGIIIPNLLLARADDLIE